MAHAIADVVMQDVATKADLDKLRHDLIIAAIVGHVTAVGFLAALIILSR